MKPFKMFMVHSDIYPDKAGGSQKLLYGLSKALANAGHNVIVMVGTSNRRLPRTEMMENFKIVRYHKNEQNPIFTVLTVLKNSYKCVSKLLRNNSFDVINLHHLLCGMGALLACIRRKCPIVYKFTSPDYLDFELEVNARQYAGIKKLLKPFYVKIFSHWIKHQQLKLLRKSAVIVCQSEYMKNKAANIFEIPYSKIRVVPHSVDTFKFFPAENISDEKEKIGIDPQRWLIITVRRLENRMGIDNLMKSMIYVRKSIPKCLLLIVGTGSLEQRLKNLVLNLELTDFVKFAGFVEDSLLPKYYRAADIFVLPTRELEGFGLATLEALASGLPVIGTPVGGIIEILSDLDPSLLTKGVDSMSIADSIVQFYKIFSRNDGISLKYINYIIKNYTWDSVVSGYEKAFEEAISLNNLLPLEKEQ